MYISNKSWNKLTPAETVKVLRLSAALNSSWSKETALPADQNKWSEGNPSIGQCAVTSLVVQKHLYGKICISKDYHHYWNQLQSGAIVDFTHDQFKINEEIESKGYVNRKMLLEGKGASKARTTERYNILNKRINIYNFEPTVFLLSSNARPEYIHDIIESMGVPEGTIRHFRYMAKYVDKALLKTIPSQGQKGFNYLKGNKAIIIYLKQRKLSQTEYEWKGSIPIRMGIIKDCYKTGTYGNSIVNFFFEIHESTLKTSDYETKLKEVLGHSYGKSFAKLTFEDNNDMVTKHKNIEIFEKQCDQLKEVGLDFEKENEANVEYEPPLFVLFEGIFQKRKWIGKYKELKPKLDLSVPKSYYCLKENTLYHYRFRTFSWKYTKPYRINLKVPNQLFDTPEGYFLNAKSAYDNECWPLTPSYVKRDTIGHIVLDIVKMEDENEKSKKSEINWILSSQFIIKRIKVPRILDLICDFLFAFGPGFIAMTKILGDASWAKKSPWIFLTENWAVVLIIIYGTWFTVKSVRKLVYGE